MKFLQHNEIDFNKWDQAILRSPAPLVFAQAFYLDATSPGWCALIRGNYDYVMPVTANKKFGVNYFLQPPFTPQLGMFGKEPKTAAGDFFTYIKQHYKYVDIELNFTNDLADSRLKLKPTYVIRFDQEYAYNSNTKRNIAKAEKNNLQCNEVAGQEAISISKKLLNPFLKNQLKIKPKQVDQFMQLLYNASSIGYLKTFVVRNEMNVVCAIGHFLSNKKHAVFLKGTSFDKDAGTGSMHFLMHHAIEHYKATGALFFDFGGGQSPSMAQFYKGFGGSELNYYLFKHNSLPKVIRWVKK